MPDPKLEEVFKLSGVPTYTFVEPMEFDKLKVALRTPGRGVIIEGPSGIGKTTAVTRGLESLGISDKATKLTPRKKDDIPLIAALPDIKDAGVVILDDFHKLDESIQKQTADFLKVLADEERADTKLVIVGINKAGDSLVSFAPDLNTRVETIRFEINPEERVSEVVSKGEQALRIQLSCKKDIVKEAAGSFFLAQMLSHHACLAAGVTEAQNAPRNIDVSYELVASQVMDMLARRFMVVAVKFATGPKLRRAGRASYLHVLKWLSEADDWSILLDHELAKHPVQRGSVGQIVDKGYLESFLRANNDFADVLHYQPATHILTVEDPQFVFFLRNLGWNKFAERVGYINLTFESRYDFALSFAGPDREVARKLFDLLSENEVSVFYDANEQSRILASNIEDYLAPIYRSEATFVVALLGPEYPKRIWTKFESEQFKARFGEGSVIPIWFATAPPGAFDESTRVGGVTFDPGKDVDKQLREISDLLIKKLAERRMTGAVRNAENIEDEDESS